MWTWTAFRILRAAYGWNCTQTNPGTLFEPCSAVYVTPSDGVFSDGWTLAVDGYTPTGCGFTVTDEWKWCQTTTPTPIGHLAGYVHTNAVKINGVINPPSSFTVGTIINP